MKESGSRIIAIILVCTTALLVGWLGLSRLLRDRKNYVEIDRSLYPIVGIDISSHNGRPDFDSLATVVDFVYLKASEGREFRDSEFGRNYSEAKRTGLPVGAYHFFRFDRDGESQAANFIDAIRGCDLCLPAAIDIEESGNPEGIPADSVTHRLQVMVNILREEGIEPLLYTNKKGHARFVRQVLSELPAPELWICSFTNPPVPHNNWLFWQHSHCSRIPGIKGPVDLNTFNGSRQDWEHRFADKGCSDQS